MSTPERLLAEYIAAYRRGEEPDPLTFIDRAGQEQRLALAALIDAYLMRAPRRLVDPTAQHQDAAAEAAVEAVHRAVMGSSGTWPALLPRLRARAGIRRDELVRRLAKALGVEPKIEKVGRYYHEMEQGLLPARGVSDRVLEALGTLLDSSAATLRRAGEAAAGAGGERSPAGLPAFARTSIGDFPSADLSAASAPSSAPADETADEVDELFRGGA